MTRARLKTLWIVTVVMLCTGPAAFTESANPRQIREWTRLLRSDDPQKRSSAATSLLATDDSSALKSLLEALQPDQPENMRVSVITAFGVKGDDRATAKIIASLDDPSDAVRQAAVAALQSINTPQSLRLLAAAAADPKRPPITRAQTLNILGELRAMEAIPSLIELLSDKEDTVRTSARAALERITLRSFSTAQEWVLWWNHAAKLSREEMLEELVTLQAEKLRSTSRMTERLYLTFLAERKDRADPAPLVTALAESDSTKVKLYAIKELAPLRGKPVLEALVKSLADTETAVRQAAVEALGTQGNAAAGPALIKTLSDAVPSVRTAAAQSLGMLKAKDAVAALCERLSDPSPETATAAAVALGELADPAALNPLIKTVSKPSTSPALYEAAANALAKINDPRAVPILVDLLHSPKETVRWAAVDALGGLHAKEAVKPLSRVVVEDRNPQIREAALAALSKIGDRGALEAMVEALSDDQKRVSEQAMRSLMQLGDADHSLFASAVDRLVAARRYALAETVLTGAIERIGRVPTSANEVQNLRTRMATGLMDAKEWAKARPHLEALVAKSPREIQPVKDLATCLTNQGDTDSLLALLAQARKSMPDQAEYCWQQTIKAVQQVAATGNSAKVIAIVDALEKESPDLGGPASASDLRGLRTQAKPKPPAAQTSPAAPKS